MNIPTITLNDGNTMPQFGLGVWQTKDGDEVHSAVTSAISDGYRLIDTASMYDNERGVGQAIADCSVARDDLFVTTKLWNSDQSHDQAIKAFTTSIEKLGLDYLDLYLIHWPAPANDTYVEAWQTLEELKKSGKTKSIGVCNFNIDHLERLMKETGTVPAINQIELHPYLQQRELREFCKQHDIQVESWSPIGGSSSNLLSDETLAQIAKKHSKSAAQVVLRWHIQLGLVVIPKSVHGERIRENANIFDFELDDTDMSDIASLDKGERFGPDPSTFNNT